MSIVRLYYVIRLYYIEPEDRHYSLGFVVGCVELNLAIVTTSVPAIWPLARKWFPKFFVSIGIDRPHHQYPDIEIAYITEPSSRSSRTSSKVYRGKIIWKDRRGNPNSGTSYAADVKRAGGGWGKLSDLPDRHLYAQKSSGSSQSGSRNG